MKTTSFNIRHTWAALLVACVASSASLPALGSESKAPPPQTRDSVNLTEIRRTRPDYVLYDPFGGKSRSWDDPDLFWLNEHILVQEARDGQLLAMWTAERLEPRHEYKVCFSRSSDGGQTWTPAQRLNEKSAAWQVPIIGPTGRIYLLYTFGWSGLACRTSDDNGRTWSDRAELAFAKCAVDNPAPGARPCWISPTVPCWDASGRPLIGYTLWATHPKYPNGGEGHSHVGYFRIENLADNPAPKDLRIRWLNLENPLTVPHATIKGASYAQEPYTVVLPDGRLFVALRSNTGNPWFSVSSDGGETWRQPEPMRFRDGGEIMKQPSSPCPVFRLKRGDYIFLFNNTDGHQGKLKGPEDRAARRPGFLCRGEFRADARQPIWWSTPRLFIDNDAVAFGPPRQERWEAATYVSLTEQQGRRVLWYPDRKCFLLGKTITDAWLDQMEIPAK